MSYGRSPYLIIGTLGDYINIMTPMGSLSRGEFPYATAHGDETAVMVPDAAMAQFISHLAVRGSAELQRWIDLGASLDDDYDGFVRTTQKPSVKAERTRWRKQLQTTVQVCDHKGRLLT